MNKWLIKFLGKKRSKAKVRDVYVVSGAVLKKESNGSTAIRLVQASYDNASTRDEAVGKWIKRVTEDFNEYNLQHPPLVQKITGGKIV